MEIARRRLTYANVIATAALLLALGGTAWAAMITSAQIKNGTVRSIDLKNGDVRSVDIRNGTVTGADLAAGSVGVTKIGTVPGAIASRATSQSIPSGGFDTTSVTLPTEYTDTLSLHSTSTDTARITAPVAGIYQVNGSLRWDADAAGTRTAGIQYTDVPANTERMVAVSSQAAFSVGLTTNDHALSGLAPLGVGDYVTLEAHQTSGGALNVLSAELSAYWVGPLT